MDPLKFPPILYFVIMAVVGVGWLMLLLFPRRHWANFWFAGVAVPTLLSLGYVILLILFWFQPPQADYGDIFTLDGVYRTFGNRGLLLVAWVNILTMDLVIGAWMARKASQTRMPYVYLLPCLVMTFIFAGIGFTMFAVAMAFGERWPAIAALEQMKGVKANAFAIAPEGAGKVS
ncbi:MAG TPA: abscisic acid-deficient protein Aba4 family protein [Thermoanaerobaculia bacterium]|nr:abscisic acid-deficient protein Aba4 family protein [Thermoanaerobaculia bacterium]